ncbi:MAG: divergent polysaccharide deacetylase family protein [Thermodesulfobacteriota bacterium]
MLEQINALLDKALQRGVAIGIAHPHDVTFDVLQETIYHIREKIRLVPISTLMAEAS